MTPDDRRHLCLAFELAARGLCSTSPNPAVGAVVVREGSVVGRGFHVRAGEEHAETIALGEAGALARGAELYLNLEHCCQHRLLEGRAATCVDQILRAGIRRVVAATRDPNPAINGRGLRKLADAGILVEPEDPFFAGWAARLNEVFFKYVVDRSPFVVLKAGMTLDGRIALPSRDSQWITGDEARTEARALRARYDAVLVGIGTALADDPLLLPAAAPDHGRLPGQGDGGGSAAEGRGRPLRPARIVLDSKLRLPLTSRLVRTAGEGPVLVYASRQADLAAERALHDRGVTVVRAGSERPELAAALADLGSREITSVLVEGGGEVLGSFLRGGHADKVHLFVAPRLMGGRGSVAAFGGEAPTRIDEMVSLRDVEIGRAGEAFVVVGYPRRA